MSGFSGHERLSQGVESGLGLAVADDLTSISMVGSCVSVTTSHPLDRVRTADVLAAMNAAIGAGSVVVTARSCSSVADAVPINAADVDRDPIEIEVVGPGLVAVECEGSTWVIDLSAHRFFRSERPANLCFVPASAWRQFDGLWISGDSISACVAPGNYVTARRSARRVTPIVPPLTELWLHRIAS